MSQELIDSLNKRVSELETKNTNLTVALRGERKDAKAAKEQLDDLLAKADKEFSGFDAEKADLQAQLDEWKAKAESTPGEQATEVERLKGEIRTRDHRDEWGKVIGKELHEKASIEDIWQKVGYKPEADKIDPAQITEFVGKAREAAPYLFVTPVASGNGAALNGASQAKIRAPLTVAESSSRGARDTASSTMSISKSMMGTPGWMTKNKAEAAAFKSGDYTVTDD